MFGRSLAVSFCVLPAQAVDLTRALLADRLRLQVFALTNRGAFATDFKLRAQIDDAVDSVCRNTAEGFGCKDREFARFLRIARRSVNEVQDQFRSACLDRPGEACLDP